MKNTVKLLVIVILVSGAFTAFAQKTVKLGHVDFQTLVIKQKGFDSLEVVMKKFEKELTDQQQSFYDEYKNKATDLDKNGQTFSATIKAIKQKELADLQQKIADYEQNTMPQLLQAKQTSMQNPFIEAAKKAITDVAKENGFTYIFEQNSLLYTQGGEDITPLAKKKLGITE